MNSVITSISHTPKKESDQKIVSKPNLKFSKKNERKILKAFLLGNLHQLFLDLFFKKMKSNSLMEYYVMDSKMLQFLIQSIIETGEYTLEGIAFYSRIPFDVIYDAACGVNYQFSFTLWTKVIDLYIQVKPDIAQILTDKLIELKKKNHALFTILLNEQ